MNNETPAPSLASIAGGLPEGFTLVWVQWIDEPLESFRGEVYRAIAEVVPVLIVHPISGRGHYTRAARRMLSRGVPDPGRLGPGLQILDIPLIPGGSRRLVRDINHREVARVARLAMHRMGASGGAVVYEFPWWWDVAEALSDRALPVYDCADYYPEFFGMPTRWAPDLERCEREIRSHGHLVVASSSRLAQRQLDLDHDADVELVDASFTRHRFEEVDLPEITRPLLVLAGFINARYDFGLLKRCLAEVPGATLVLAGHLGVRPGSPEAEAVDWLRAHGAVVTGKLTHAQLRGLARRADVGLMPYVPMAMNHYARPAKMVDFLGAGVPVVSTSVPDLGDASTWVRVADSGDDFVAAVRAAAAGGRLEDPALRAWAAGHTDEAVAGRILGMIAERLAGAGRAAQPVPATVD